MKKFFIIFIFIICVTFFNDAFSYVIENTENVIDKFIVPESNTDPHFSIKPDLSARKYVKSYKAGGTTAIQVCEIGGLGYDHAYAAGEDYQRNLITEVTPPSCTSDGFMTIKCTYPIESGFLGLSRKECGKTEKIILLKTGHTVSEHSIDGKCENCNEVHSKKDLLDDKFSDEENHYYSCSFEGCTENISERHEFIKNNEKNQFICKVCNKIDLRHKAKDEWMGDGETHYKPCAVEGCDEKFEEGKHNGGNHSNLGMCSECNQQYQTHNMDTSKFTATDEGHQYGCSYEGCEEVIFSEHEKDTEISGWNGESHWYCCTNEDCDKKFDEMPHSDGDNLNGVCIYCNRKYDGELESFEIVNIENGAYEFSEVGDNIKLELLYEPENLADTNFIWSSDNENVATVTQDGVVTAISKGSTEIYVQWKDEKISCTIYVSMNTFEIKAEEDEIYEDKTTQLKVVTENIPKNIKWSVEPSRLGWIDEEYVFHAIIGEAKKEGEKVTIYAKLENGVATSTEIFIKHGEASHSTDGKCKICGLKIEEHKLTIDYDEKNHWNICSNPKCKGEKFSISPHTSKTHCEECDWEEEEPTSPEPTPSEPKPPTPVTPVPTPPEPKPPVPIVPEPGSETGVYSEWVHMGNEHWRYLDGEKVDWHMWAEKPKPCSKCGYSEEQQLAECEHLNTYFIPSDTEGYHFEICTFCHKIISEGACPPGCTCAENLLKKIETDLNIDPKVFYIEEYDRPLYIEPDIVSASVPKFEWTLSTIKNPNYNPDSASSSKYKIFKNGEVADDGTILFWYEDEKFCAQLKDSDRKKLSEEVEVRITLIDGPRRDTQIIKLITTGPPRSYCQVYIDSKYVLTGSSTLSLLMKTKYNDFNDDDVKAQGEVEFPLYKVKDIKIDYGSQITPEQKSRLTLGNKTPSPQKENEDFNGYFAEIDVIGNEPGNIPLEVTLTTEYTYAKYQPVEKERKYTVLLEVIEKEDQIDDEDDGVPLDPVDGEDNNEDGGSGLSSAILAAAGLLGLLLVVIVGSKAFGHR